MKMDIPIKNFMTPNYVLPDLPINSQGMKWEIKDVPADVLSELCDEFRKEIFEKAGVADPRLKEQS